MSVIAYPLPGETHRYLMRITSLDQRTVFEVQPSQADTIEDARTDAANLFDATFLADTAESRTTILLRPDLTDAMWVVSCWRIADGPWQYPEPKDD